MTGIPKKKKLVSSVPFSTLRDYKPQRKSQITINMYYAEENISISANDNLKLNQTLELLLL